MVRRVGKFMRKFTLRDNANMDKKISVISQDGIGKMSDSDLFWTLLEAWELRSEPPRTSSAFFVFLSGSFHSIPITLLNTENAPRYSAQNEAAIDNIFHLRQLSLSTQEKNRKWISG
ncbi:hypothetical protein JHK85_009398 [Glycine max]|nr:hypothetical protein JHK85_009398 [Glycine max]